MKNQGISLISLIITIIVIIILAAIVLFNGLNAPNSANFAKFTQSVDNVSMAVLNKYANLLEKHSISGDSRTQEQIYCEIATGADQSQTTHMNTADVTTSGAGTGVINIKPEAAKTSEYSIGMTLPLVRESNAAWYVTKDGIVFNATGYEYDGKVYFTGAYYSKDTSLTADKTNKATRAKKIADAIASGETELKNISDN